MSYEIQAAFNAGLEVAETKRQLERARKSLQEITAEKDRAKRMYEKLLNDALAHHSRNSKLAVELGEVRRKLGEAVEELKDAHSYITDDKLRERIGTLINLARGQ